MRVNLEWLGDWVDAGFDGKALAAELTTAGLEVDSVSPVAGQFEGVVVARILSVVPHPDADRLQLCEVDDGTATRRVVCGADNVAAGRCAAFAPEGARLPDGTVIRAAAVRGQQSEGMLCAADELGMAGAGDGILLLEDDAPVGASLLDYLRLDDTILDIDLTPNRGDCFSVRGLAREIAAKRALRFDEPELPVVAVEIHDTFPVRLEAPQACPRFAGRVIRGLNPSAVTPLWMRERLRRAGIRCISPVVDVTNYVMLELGQPLHAYDLTKLNDGIIVRFAQDGEQLVLLDERQVALHDQVLVIADQQRAVGLAGIMGGLDTAVHSKTRDVFLEAAHFTPDAVAGRAREFALHSDASIRFERGVDPDLPARAIERATALLVRMAGAMPGPVVVTDGGGDATQRATIQLRHRQVEAVLGLELDADTIESVLGRLGMTVTPAKDGWQIVPPTHRFDLSIEEDLIEEVGRLIGYDNIPAVPGSGSASPGTSSESRVDEDRIADLLVARGYTEVVTYSFIDEALQDLITPERASVALANPISSDMNVMRRSLWPGLLDVARQNLSRQQTRLRVFEIGTRFEPASEDGMGVAERTVVAGLAAGLRLPEQWDVRSEAVDFYDIKADIEGLISLTGRTAELQFTTATHPALHPGQCAQITLAGEAVGWLGRLHPRVERKLDIKTNVILFALDTERAFASVVPSFRPISRYPSVRRDLAVVVNESVEAAQLTALAQQAGGPLLQRAYVFDIYRGKGIDSSRKSVALGLILQDTSRTLTDADADRIVQSVTHRLERELGATIRT